MGELLTEFERHRAALETVLAQCAAIRATASPQEQAELIGGVLEACEAAEEGEYSTAMLEAFLPQAEQALQRLQKRRQPMTPAWLTNFGAIGLGLGPLETQALIAHLPSPSPRQAFDKAKTMLLRTFPNAEPMQSWVRHSHDTANAVYDLGNKRAHARIVLRLLDNAELRVVLEQYDPDDPWYNATTVSTMRLFYENGRWRKSQDESEPTLVSQALEDFFALVRTKLDAPFGWL
jgi:hypothetical protein